MPLCFHGFDEQSVQIVLRLVRYRLHWWYPHLLSEWGRTCKSFESCSTNSLSLVNVSFGCNLLLFCHIISSERIQVDSQKIGAVKQWPRPTSTTYIRSFLGLVGYYIRFVEGFSSIASPLTRLTQKMVKFQWWDDCEKSFQNWKID